MLIIAPDDIDLNLFWIGNKQATGGNLTFAALLSTENVNVDE